MFHIVAPFRTPLSLRTALFHSQFSGNERIIADAIRSLTVEFVTLKSEWSNLNSIQTKNKQRRYATLDQDSYQNFCTPLVISSPSTIDGEKNILRDELESLQKVIEKKYGLIFDPTSLSIQLYDNTIGIMCFNLSPIMPTFTLDMSPRCFDEITVDISEQLLFIIYDYLVVKPYLQLFNKLNVPRPKSGILRRSSPQARLVRSTLEFESFFDAGLAVDRTTLSWPSENSRSHALLWASRIYCGNYLDINSDWLSQWLGSTDEEFDSSGQIIDLRIGNSRLLAADSGQSELMTALDPYLKAQYFSALISVSYFNLLTLQTDCVASRENALGMNRSRLYNLISQIDATKTHIQVTAAGLQGKRSLLFRQAMRLWGAQTELSNASEAARSLKLIVSGYEEGLRQKYIKLVEIFLGLLAVIGALDFINNVIWFSKSADYNSELNRFHLYNIARAFDPNLFFSLFFVLCLVASMFLLRANRKLKRSP